ncbi:hypothetical protein [Marinifilum caeruleilacunae]|uniref:Uncharacterized protein n=1 Tax=Marinifilum caeruleilacunae TaxID=2499076 RepID=A0ABX1WSD9_9BACT|nr:hypothetical protein [Marinifilum caeruleilacunae]NOU59020.1 hypothetical protein [Marinifilum caeruleilacunae]
MAYNSWEDIYRSKKTEELYRIYKGVDYSTYDQKKLALKVLQERKFDFENVEPQVRKWKKEKIKKEEEFKANKPILSFIDRNFGYILACIFGMFFLSAYSEYVKFDQDELHGTDQFVLSLITFGPLVSVAVALLIQHLRSKKRKSKLSK